jgi:hypothetical protein
MRHSRTGVEKIEKIGLAPKFQNYGTCEIIGETIKRLQNSLFYCKMA